MPEPTKTASAPSCIISAASAGVAMPPAEKFGTGSLPALRDPAHAARRARRGSWPRSSAPRGRGWSAAASPDMTARMWRTASTMLPEPASPLVRIMAAPSPMRRSASPRSRAPHTNGIAEGELVDVEVLVGRRQHLGLVDVVDGERLEDLRLDEVADARLGHHRDGHRLLDLPDLAHRRPCAPRRLPCGCRRARARAPSPTRRPRPRRSWPARRW